jgi:hypothetical protein
LARHLCHDIKTHKAFYRLQDTAVELAKISSTLHKADAGILLLPPDQKRDVLIHKKEDLDQKYALSAGIKIKGDVEPESDFEDEVEEEEGVGEDGDMVDWDGEEGLEDKARKEPVTEDEEDSFRESEDDKDDENNRRPEVKKKLPVTSKKKNSKEAGREPAVKETLPVTSKKKNSKETGHHGGEAE